MAKEYKVLKITELTKLTDTGGVERFYRHQVKTKGGTIISIDISEADFTPDKAAPLLEKKATEADKVLAL